MSFFSKNLEYLRKDNKISRSELAEKINVNQSTIARWENEEMGVTVENAYDVANFFGVSIADLTGKDLQNVKEKKFDELDQLFSQISDLSEEKQKVIINVTKSVMKEIDKSLDGEE